MLLLIQSRDLLHSAINFITFQVVKDKVKKSKYENPHDIPDIESKKELHLLKEW